MCLLAARLLLLLLPYHYHFFFIMKRFSPVFCIYVSCVILFGSFSTRNLKSGFHYIHMYRFVNYVAITIFRYKHYHIVFVTNFISSLTLVTKNFCLHIRPRTLTLSRYVHVLVYSDKFYTLKNIHFFSVCHTTLTHLVWY